MFGPEAARWGSSGRNVAANPIDTPATARRTMPAPTRTLESTRVRATPRDSVATAAGTTLSIAAPARPSAAGGADGGLCQPGRHRNGREPPVQRVACGEECRE